MSQNTKLPSKAAGAMSLVAFSCGALLFIGALSGSFLVASILPSFPYGFGTASLTHVVTSVGATLAVGVGAYAIADARRNLTAKARHVPLAMMGSWSGAAAIIGWFIPYPYLGTVLVPAIVLLFVAFRRPLAVRITSRPLTPIAAAFAGAVLGPVLLSLATVGATSTDGNNVLYLLYIMLFQNYVAPMAIFLGLQLTILALVLSEASPPPDKPLQPRSPLLLVWLSPIITTAVGLPVLVLMAGDCVLELCFGSFLLAMIAFPILLGLLDLAGLLLWAHGRGGGHGMRSSMKSEPGSVYP